jgi:Protein of unknown function (DUF2958)
MELLPKDIETTLPPLYSTENVPDPVAVIKFFDPCGRFTFFVLEGQRESDSDYLFFGFCRSPLGPDCDEFGFASLRELQSVRGPLGLGIERDLYFKPTPLSRLMMELGMRGKGR